MSYQKLTAALLSKLSFFFLTVNGILKQELLFSFMIFY